MLYKQWDPALQRVRAMQDQRVVAKLADDADKTNSISQFNRLEILKTLKVSLIFVLNMAFT